MNVTSPRNQRLPEKYYRRRRLAAVVVILVVVALIIWGLSALARSGSGDPDDTAAPAQNTTAQQPATTAAEDTGDTEESEESEESETTGEATTAEEEPAGEDADREEAEDTDEPADGGCALSDLEISADSDRANYPSGTQPTFYMTVANPTRSDCEIDLDEETLRFEVYDLSTNERIWSDTDCYDSVQTGTETFEAGEERYFEAVWSRTASAPGQCDNRPAAEPGGYFLHTVVGDNPSEAHTFNLR